MNKSKNLAIVTVLMTCLTLCVLASYSYVTHYINGQIVPKNNTQSTSPNNRTSIMVIINHGAANYTISDFIPTMISNKCPMTAHLIDNNNMSNNTAIPAKPIIICYQ